MNNMNEESKPISKEDNLKNVEQVRDLFARAHDYIAQASHPGHLGGKVAEVLNFLAFQYNDFKLRGEKLTKDIEAAAKVELSKVDVEAAKNAVDATLNEPTGNDSADAPTTPYPQTYTAPKAS
jgi:hypothetical protein